MALFTSVKNNLAGLFKGIGDRLVDLKVPQTPQPPQTRTDTYTNVGRTSSYHDFLNGHARPPQKETIDRILASVLDVPPPPPSKS